MEKNGISGRWGYANWFWAIVCCKHEVYEIFANMSDVERKKQ